MAITKEFRHMVISLTSVDLYPCYWKYKYHVTVIDFLLEVSLMTRYYVVVIWVFKMCYPSIEKTTVL